MKMPRTSARDMRRTRCSDISGFPTGLRYHFISTKYKVLPSSITPSICSTIPRSEEHTSELQSQSNLVCRLLLEKKKKKKRKHTKYTRRQKNTEQQNQT